jgi:hypothetical protein
MEKMLPLEPAGNAAPKVIEMTEAEMQRYVGRYAQGSMTVDVFVDNGKLSVRQGQAPSALQVAKVGEGRFAVMINDKPGNFVIHAVPGPDGKPLFIYAGSRALKRAPAP